MARRRRSLRPSGLKRKIRDMKGLRASTKNNVARRGTQIDPELGAGRFSALQNLAATAEEQIRRSLAMLLAGDSRGNVIPAGGEQQVLAEIFSMETPRWSAIKAVPDQMKYR
jgi:inner membrane protein involved in colicin E2 resistance